MIRQFKGYRIDKQIDVQNKVYGIVYIFNSIRYRETDKLWNRIWKYIKKLKMGYVHIWRSIYLSVKKNWIYDNRKIGKYSN